jgi:hypothetical protein
MRTAGIREEILAKILIPLAYDTWYLGPNRLSRNSVLQLIFINVFTEWGTPLESRRNAASALRTPQKPGQYCRRLKNTIGA